MKKITPVFGPQELFDACLNDVVCVSKNDDTGEIFQYTNIIIALRDLTKYKGNSDFTVAMRRIEEAPDSIDLSGDIDRLIEPEFSEWWENYGQLVGSGGGDRERTFAFAALRYLMPKILGQKQPEPKRWTVADQKAGRLPEVGAEYNVDGCIVEHLGNGAVGYQNIFYFKYPSGACGNAHERLAKPIETTEDKAQREEDEFISSLSGTDIHDGTVKDFFAQGARAAYRKLKGGE